MMNPVTILPFGKLRDLIGGEMTLGEVAGRSVGDMRHVVAGRCPAAADDLLSPRVLVCVNDVVVGEEHLLQPGDEVALLPPVSGG